MSISHAPVTKGRMEWANGEGEWNERLEAAIGECAAIRPLQSLVPFVVSIRRVQSPFPFAFFCGMPGITTARSDAWYPTERLPTRSFKWSMTKIDGAGLPSAFHMPSPLVPSGPQ